MEIKLKPMEIRSPRQVPGPTYSTRDFYLAAALQAKGAHFLRVDRQGSVGFFLFSNQNKCEQWVESYFQGKLMVAAKEMTSAIRSLKDALFSSTPNERQM